MDNIIEFIGDNYAWFLTITIILLFALIGYIYDSKRNKSDLVKKRENELEEASLENLKIEEDKSLSNMIVNSKNINPETKTVELVDPNILKEDNKNNEIVNNPNPGENNNKEVTNQSEMFTPVNETVQTLGNVVGVVNGENANQAQEVVPEVLNVDNNINQN